MYEKVYASPRPPPKISLKHDWLKELGSEVAQRPDGEVVQQSKSSQSHAKIYDRTWRPVAFSLWIKLQTNGFHEFLVLYFVAIGSFTADVGLLQPTEGVNKDNHLKRPVFAV